jgi:hypothetical protein
MSADGCCSWLTGPATGGTPASVIVTVQVEDLLARAGIAEASDGSQLRTDLENLTLFMQMPPHPFPAERLELSNQRGWVTGMDTAEVDRPRTTPATQQPDPTTPRPTPTQPAATSTRRRMNDHDSRNHLLPQSATCLTLRPFLHLGQNLAGAQSTLQGRQHCRDGRTLRDGREPNPDLAGGVT